ncbi:MAG: hypothetical protein V1702_00610 [Candidatus Woesearchaeota archaeon]
MKNRTLAIIAFIFPLLAVISATIAHSLRPYGSFEVCDRILAVVIHRLTVLAVTWLPLLGIVLGIFALIGDRKKDEIRTLLASLAIIMSILVFLSSYFGILNPQNFSPDRCEFQQGFYCKEHQVIDAGKDKMSFYEFTFQNARGTGMMIERITIRGTGRCLSNVFCDTGSSLTDYNWSGKPGLHVENGASVNVEVPCGIGTFSGLGGRFKMNFDVNVTWYDAAMNQKYNHLMQGQVLEWIESQ